MWVSTPLDIGEDQTSSPGPAVDPDADSRPGALPNLGYAGWSFAVARRRLDKAGISSK